jgi:hypothetical protein
MEFPDPANGPRLEFVNGLMYRADLRSAQGEYRQKTAVALFLFRPMPVEVFPKGMKRRNNDGGADGIVSDPLKKTQEKPLNLRTYCHLLILALSFRSPHEPSGHPHSARNWQQLATVKNQVATSAVQASLVVSLRYGIHD